jgi:signal peptidase II
MKHKKYLFASLIVASIIIIDQITKYIVLKLLKPVINVKLFPFLYLTYTENTGAGFSILQNQKILLIILSILIIGFLIYYYKKFKKNEQFPIQLILGGAIGNLIDRISHGFVIDFINIRIWPIFNVADSAISIGIILLLYNNFFKNKK